MVRGESEGEQAETEVGDDGEAEEQDVPDSEQFSPGVVIKVIFFVMNTWVTILGNCNIFVKRKISVINEMKRDKILWKPFVFDEY